MTQKVFPVWKETPEGFVTHVYGHDLRVGHKLDNGQFAYFVHKSGAQNQTRSEALTQDEAKQMAIAMAEANCPAPPEEKNRLSFDEAAIAEMQDAAQLVISRHPEIRSVVVVFDYAKGFAEAKKGLWLGDKGVVTDLAAIHGSIDNTLAILEQMFYRAAAHANAMTAQTIEITKTLLEKRKEMIALDAELTRIRAEIDNARGILAIGVAGPDTEQRGKSTAELPAIEPPGPPENNSV